MMASIYILSDWGKLSKRGETIVFAQADGTETILFPFKTERLVLIGKVSISADAFQILSRYRISVTFLSSNGKFGGKLSFGDGKNVFVRRNQFRILEDEKKSLEIARSIVTGKIRNEISFMQRIKRKEDSATEKIESALEQVKSALSDAKIAENMERLRGYEGFAARKYFEVFSCNIIPEWAEFKSRSKNPPKSNVNAVLSFLYTLLMYRVEAALEGTGLDLCAGTLHTADYGKTALVFDLMEEFRSPVCDTVCCSLFNLGTISEDDFETKKFGAEDDDYPLENGENSAETDGETGVLLTKSGIKKAIESFEAKMDSIVYFPPLERKISHAQIIFQQAVQYKRVVCGEETEYKPFFFK